MLKEYCLDYLEKMGLNPLISTTASKMKAYFWLFVQGTVLMLVLSGLHFSGRELYATTDAFIGALLSLHIYLKHIYIFARKKEFAEVINTRKEFWPKDQFGQEAAMKIDRILDVARKCIIILMYFMAISGVAYMTAPLVSGKRMLPLPFSSLCNIEDNTYCYVCIYTVEIFYTYGSVRLLLVFDRVFFILISYGYCELEQVKLAFLKLELDSAAAADEDWLLIYLAVIVKQHNRALKFLEKVNNLYSYVLLVQLPSTLISFCTTFFLIVANSFPPTLTIALRSLPLILPILFEIVLYCAAGQVLIEQSESVADGVYSTNWWNRNQPRLRRALCLIIQRSQRPVEITAGGVFGLHMETLVSVLKGAASALTFMQTFSGQN